MKLDSAKLTPGQIVYGEVDLGFVLYENGDLSEIDTAHVVISINDRLCVVPLITDRAAAEQQGDPIRTCYARYADDIKLFNTQNDALIASLKDAEEKSQRESSCIADIKSRLGINSLE